MLLPSLFVRRLFALLANTSICLLQQLQFQTVRNLRDVPGLLRFRNRSVRAWCIIATN
jgi:hypothetical protein